MRVCMFMRFFTSQRPGLWILIISCFFRVFIVFRFRDFFLFFFLLFFLFFFTICGCCFLFRLLFSSGCHALSDVLPHFSNPGFSILRHITTKHVCKAFLQEYRIRDIRFRVLWSKQDPNAKGEDEHERNRKKTGPQRRREKRPRKKYEKITRKK